MCRLFLVIFAVAVMTLGVGVLSPAAERPSARKILNATLTELRLENAPLSEAIEYLRDVTNANIHVNWRAIEEIGIARDTTINIRLRGVPVRKVLTLVLSEASHDNQLAYYVNQNVIEITTRELADRDLITRGYAVDDVLDEAPDVDQTVPQFQIQATRTGRGGGGGGQNLFGSLGQTQNQQQNTKAQTAQELIDLIQTSIQPTIWNTAGGPAAIRFFNDSLIISAPRSVHEALGGIVE
jgi:hypothetical protein